MTASVLDLFSIGIGPSSSHTVGPMRAARLFTAALADADLLQGTTRVRTELYGSLGATGLGHGSDTAAILGLGGEDPETVDPRAVPAIIDRVTTTGRLELAGRRTIGFHRPRDLVLHRRRSLPGHPNGMRLLAYGAGGEVILQRDYYSIGGGFVHRADELGLAGEAETEVPHPYSSADELLQRTRETGLTIAQIVQENELARHSEGDLRERLLAIWEVMRECVRSGCTSEQETLPGGLAVRRRAPELHRRLLARAADPEEHLPAIEWVDLYALAVNEENASGGRIVTAPTNGAAGIVPAVLHYFHDFCRGASEDRIVEFLLTAGAVGLLLKANASISGAEVGCQGEVGSACAMAAAGLSAALGGTPAQIENAAEIGLEHHLGLTCDPIGGLVQVPCIERNAIAAVTAINAARLALAGDGSHRVTLDQATATMSEIGREMKTKYKETSRGGLAVNAVEC